MNWDVDTARLQKDDAKYLEENAEEQPQALDTISQADISGRLPVNASKPTAQPNSRLRGELPILLNWSG